MWGDHSHRPVPREQRSRFAFRGVYLNWIRRWERHKRTGRRLVGGEGEEVCAFQSETTSCCFSIQLQQGFYPSSICLQLWSVLFQDAHAYSEINTYPEQTESWAYALPAAMQRQRKERCANSTMFWEVVSKSSTPWFRVRRIWRISWDFLPQCSLLSNNLLARERKAEMLANLDTELFFQRKCTWFPENRKRMMNVFSFLGGTAHSHCVP